MPRDRMEIAGEGPRLFVPPRRRRMTRRGAVIAIGVILATVLISIAVIRWLERTYPDRGCSGMDCWIVN